MKIGINSRMYQNNMTGIPYYIECLYKECLKVDHDNEYIFFQTKKTKMIGNTHVIKRGNSVIDAFLFDNFLIRKLIKQDKIDVYHGPASILPFFKDKNVRYVLTVHDLSFLVFPNNNSKIFNLYYKYFVGRSLKNADVIVADSENTKRDIAKFYSINKNKIRVIYPGVNNLFLSKTHVKRLIQEKYFFTLSTHPERKNIYRVIELLESNNQLSNHVFVIAGLIPADQLSKLKVLIKKLHLQDQIILFGYATEEELMSLYQHAEFFIYPSYYEGFGFPILEAMLSRCPVIASNTSSIPEITPNKDWLFNPNSTKGIQRSIEKMISLTPGNREKLIQDNLIFASKFSWHESAMTMIKAYRS